MIITGDVLVHGVQLIQPDVAYAYEADPDLARQTRVGLLARARESQAVLATSHLARPFVDPR